MCQCVRAVSGPLDKVTGKLEPVAVVVLTLGVLISALGRTDTTSPVVELDSRGCLSAV